MIRKQIANFLGGIARGGNNPKLPHHLE